MNDVILDHINLTIIYSIIFSIKTIPFVIFFSTYSSHKVNKVTSLLIVIFWNCDENSKQELPLF